MPNLKINRKLLPLITVQKALKIVIGGRGSGKSIGFADALCMDMETKGTDVLCLREHQNSISDSVHRTFEASIKDRLKLQGWVIQENKIISPSGSKTSYKGAARNPDAIQSAAGYKRSWFEEAHRASQTSLDKLIPTIIRTKGSECWFSANPQNSNDAFSKRFINPYLKELQGTGTYEDDLHLIIVLNWRDNPWWGEEQESLRAWDFENISRTKYDWIWEGRFNDSVENSIIKPEWFDASIDAHLVMGIKPLGYIVASHDPSDTGTDSKGFILRHGSVILDVKESGLGDVNHGCDWALDMTIQAQADYFVWDCDGLGVSLKRQVYQSLNGKKIEPVMFKGSESPDDPDDLYQGSLNSDFMKERTNRQTFRNKRAQHYMMLRDRFQNTYRAIVKKEYVDPDTMICISSDIEHLDKLRSEVCSIPLKQTGNGLIQILRKDEMKKRGISSPNLADSLMMSMVNPLVYQSTMINLTFDSEF